MRVERICEILSEVANVTILARWQGEKLEKETIGNFSIKRVGFNTKSIASSPYPFNQLWKKEITNAIAILQPKIVVVREIMLAEIAAKISHKHNINCIIDMAENYPAAMRAWKKYNDSLPRKIAVQTLKLPDIVERRAVKEVDFIITVCEEQNERLAKEYKFSKEKSIAVYNTPSSSFASDKASIKSEIPIFGHHGYLSADKNLDKFIQGFAKAIEKNGAKYQLHLHGDGESRNDLEKLVQTLNMQDSIKFFGSYQFNDLDAIIDSYDFGIVPYTPNGFNNYTIHNKFFDFIAKGKPILASETLPFKRIFAENNIGLCRNCEDINSIALAIEEMQMLDFVSISANAIKLFKDKLSLEKENIKLLKYLKTKNLIDE